MAASPDATTRQFSWQSESGRWIGFRDDVNALLCKAYDELQIQGDVHPHVVALPNEDGTDDRVVDLAAMEQIEPATDRRWKVTMSTRRAPRARVAQAHAALEGRFGCGGPVRGDAHAAPPSPSPTPPAEAGARDAADLVWALAAAQRLGLADGDGSLAADDRERLDAALAHAYATCATAGPLPGGDACDDECVVCGADIRTRGGVTLAAGCGHRTLCLADWRTYVAHRVESGDVSPWLTCPADECQARVDPRDLCGSGLDARVLAALLVEVLARRLAQCDSWAPCKREGCRAGFLCGGDATERAETRAPTEPPPPPPPGSPRARVGPKARKKDRASGAAVARTVACQLCGLKQTPRARGAESRDPEVDALIDAGLLRTCPVCEFPTMKDKGICNVLQCGRCAIWWNWTSRATGHTQEELKARARATGTLWQHEDFAYQLHLERNDKPAFIALLKRNGQEYDPNYRRGG